MIQAYYQDLQISASLGICGSEVQSIKEFSKDCVQCSYLAGCLCHLCSGSSYSIVMTGWSSAQQVHTVKTGYWCKRSEAAFCRAHTERATADAIMCWLGKQPVDQKEKAKLDQRSDASKLSSIDWNSDTHPQGCTALQVSFWPMRKTCS